MIQVEQHGSVTVIRMARAILGRPLYWTAAYWLDGLLIDSGPRCTAHELVRVLDQVPVRQIAVTHSHEDHIGGLAALLDRYPSATVYAARQALPQIADPELLQLHRYRRWVWGCPAPVDRVQSLDEVADRLCTPRYTLRAVETPGHSRDHVSYFEPSLRWLFCGDAFVGGRDLACTPELNLFAAVSSLRTLATLRPERLFPGSGTVCRTPQPELFGKIGALVQLAADVQKLVADGRTTEEIVQMLFGGEPPLRWWTFGHVSAAHLVDACRQYNELVPPAGVALPPDIAEGRRTRRPNSSTRRPSDSGDRAR